MHRFLRVLPIRHVLGSLGLFALVAFVLINAETVHLGLMQAGIALGLAVLVWLMLRSVARYRARRAARPPKQGIDNDSVHESHQVDSPERAQAATIQKRVREAIQTLKSSKLGERSVRGALYALPWYMVIGNPAAGKSTSIVQSGLRFPFSRSTENILQGIGGTRNCDWFFSNDGILIDTAGRYAVRNEDKGEWLGFLALLKKNRPKAPINGILIAASIAELNEARPGDAISLAESLRQRVQELTETLEVFAPVYVMFTKADLIAGFVEFFEDHDAKEREKVWGATLPYKPDPPADTVAQFNAHFDALQDGLKALALARMSLHRGEPLSPAVLAFPLEFAGTKAVLRSFIATLFQDNPFQYRPIFRGFYFTSAVQMGVSSSRTRTEVADQFTLLPSTDLAPAAPMTENGFFLKDLFARVIFADRHLVRQHASRTKLRARSRGYAVCVLGLAVLLACWTWSYVGNRQIVNSVLADLNKAMRLQDDRIDLASRLEALELLQNRIEELSAWRENRPLSVSMGLYQGDAIERKLRQEYFQGVRRLMLEPVSQALEGYLAEVNAHAADLKPPANSGGMPRELPASGAPGDAGAAPRYAPASATRVEDAYKALKTYLMLADRERMEPGHLTDQVTRFWRGWLESNRGTMPRDTLMRSAERMISFSMGNLRDAAFPVLTNNFGLVDQTRDNLRRVVHGTPAIERVYGDIKARASTRFGSMTVAGIVGDKGKETLVGSYVVSGTFTREAWNGYIDKAFKDAAIHELQSTDWVLKTSNRDDLSLQGSPEQIRKTLTDLYKTEYVREWQRFAQSVSIADFGSFDATVDKMNILSSTGSPIRKLFSTLFDQTAWDNPLLADERLAGNRRGLAEWFQQAVLHRTSTDMSVQADPLGEPAHQGVPVGPIGREFAALPRFMLARDGGASLLDTYLQSLGKVRSRFNQMLNEGDVGPVARTVMAATFESGGSELVDALKFVDEQMLGGASDGERATYRPLLVRPLIQSFNKLVAPTETEVNRLWSAQVLQPFQQNLAGKYPFDPTSKIEAAPAEIVRVFGPDGAIARFATGSLGSLVTRRGDAIFPRRWANLGLRLRPAFVHGLPTWIAMLDGPAGQAQGAAVGAPAAMSAVQANFELLPQGAAGFVQYTLMIDGQPLNYRNGPAAWQNFVWPHPAGTPGARINGVTADGRTVEVFSAPGAYGFERLIDAAHVRKLPLGVRELSWGEGLQTVSVHYRAVTSPGPAAAPPAGGSESAGVSGGNTSGLRGLKLPELVAGADAPTLAHAADGVVQ